MDRTKEHANTNFPIHEAATTGDYEATRRALEFGADINALDHAGRTVIACAVAGEDWANGDASEAALASKSRLQVLRILLSHPDISLFTLNAPQSVMKGVTPLGMAAWLNIPEFVCALLEDTAEAVSVDGMDSYGATALMYAARDGNLAVVQHLLYHGARPDFRDMNHRTSIQYSLLHTQVLWLCEAVLRRHRWQEHDHTNKCNLFGTNHDSPTPVWNMIAASFPPHHVLFAPSMTTFTNELTSFSTQQIIDYVASSDLPSLQSLLFSPSTPSTTSTLLVNLPDSDGWSPIHHCVSICPPSMDVLDTLYVAGSDISLFTAFEHYTPLHVLALSSRLPTDRKPADYGLILYTFAIHLIRDLQAPLSARDREDETPIHIAAEKGGCIDLLVAFLECDTTGQVRDMRNSRGLTALKVARPEFRSAFKLDSTLHKAISSVSMHTIRPRPSITSISSTSTAWTPALLPPNEHSLTSFDMDLSSSARSLLYSLRITSPLLHHNIPDNHTFLLDKAEYIAEQIVSHFHTNAEQAQEELNEAMALFESTFRFLGVIERKVKDDLERRQLVPLVKGHSHGRWSGDSQATAVSLQERQTREAELLIAVEDNTAPMDAPAPNGSPRCRTESLRPHFTPWSGWLGHLLADSPFRSHFTNQPPTEPEHKDKGTRTRTKSLTKRDASHVSGTVRLTTWLKKKVMPEPSFGPEVARNTRSLDIETHSDNVEAVRVLSLPYPKNGAGPGEADAGIKKVLRTAHIALTASKRDLDNIKIVIAAADQYIEAARQLIMQVERVVERALKKRRTVEHLPPDMVSIDDALISIAFPSGPCRVSEVEPPGYPPSSPSSAGHFSSTFSSAQSSCVSLASTLGHCDDGDTKALRRLLLRKIEARLSGAFDEIDKATSWLQIVNEVIRGVRRRAYL